MTTTETGPPSEFARAASPGQVASATAALSAYGFAVEVLRDAADARTRVRDPIPAGASVLTASSETLRASGIDEDINGSGRHLSVRDQVQAMDRSAEVDDIRRLAASPDVVIGSVAAVTETGSLIAASASGSQLPAYSGGAPAIWIVGAQKIVPDMPAALGRLDEYALPREDERAQRAYGRPSAVNFMLTLNAELRPGRATGLLLQEAIGVLNSMPDLTTTPQATGREELRWTMSALCKGRSDGGSRRPTPASTRRSTPGSESIRPIGAAGRSWPVSHGLRFGAPS